jgi:hypothetical protein
MRSENFACLSKKKLLKVQKMMVLTTGTLGAAFSSSLFVSVLV